MLTLVPFIAALGLLQPPDLPVISKGVGGDPLLVLEIEPSNILIVKARINGASARVVVDTGSFNAVLQWKFAAECHAELSGLVTIADTRGAERKLLTNPGSASKVFRPTVKVGPHSPLQGCDAIIGLHFFQEGAIGIDTLGNAFSFWPEGNLSEEARRRWFDNAIAHDSNGQMHWVPPGAVGEPDAARLRNGLPKEAQYKSAGLRTKSLVAGESSYLTTAWLNGRKLDVVVDTGASAALVPASEAGRLKLPPTVTLAVLGLSANWTAEATFLETLKTEWMTQRVAGVIVQPPEIPCPALIGFESFRGSKTIVDFAARKIYVYHPEPERTLRRILADYGIVVLGDKLTVIKDSPAAAAGLKHGDGFVRVEVPREVGSFDDLDRALGQSLTMIYKRDGEESTVVLRPAGAKG